MIPKSNYKHSIIGHRKAIINRISRIRPELVLLMGSNLPKGQTIPGSTTVQAHSEWADNVGKALDEALHPLEAYLAETRAFIAKTASDLKVRTDGALNEHGDFEL